MVGLRIGWRLLLKKIYGNQYTTNTSVNFLPAGIHFRLSECGKVWCVLYFFVETNLGESGVGGWKEKEFYCGFFTSKVWKEFLSDGFLFVQSQSGITVNVALLYRKVFHTKCLWNSALRHFNFKYKLSFVCTENNTLNAYFIRNVTPDTIIRKHTASTLHFGSFPCLFHPA